MSRFYYGNLEPGARYRIDDDGRAIKTKSAGTKASRPAGFMLLLQRAHQNYKTNVTEIFLPGCWGDTLYDDSIPPRSQIG